VISKLHAADDLADPWLRSLLNYPQVLLRWLDTQEAPYPALLAWLLVNLGTVSLTEPMDPATSQLERLAKYLRKNDHTAALRTLRTLSRADCNQLGTRILRALAGVLDSEDALAIKELDPPILAELFQLNPRLAAHSDIWEGSAHQQWQLLRSLHASENLGPDVLQVVADVFLRKTDPPAEAFIECLGSPGVTALLNQIGLAEPLPDAAWQKALSDAPSTVVDWLRHQESPSASIVAWLTACLDPLSAAVQNGDPAFWVDLWLSGHPTLPAVQRNLFATFLLTVALRSGKLSASALARETFSPVHQMAARSELPYEAGRRLESLLPDLGWWKNWDTCERLRRSFASFFVERHWPEQDFVRAMPDQPLLSATLNSCRKLDGGKKFLRHLRDVVEAGEFEVPYWQRRAILDY
jgi:hypothetical protein